jgi:hypothetical protein
VGFGRGRGLEREQRVGEGGGRLVLGADPVAVGLEALALAALAAGQAVVTEVGVEVVDLGLVGLVVVGVGEERGGGRGDGLGDHRLPGVGGVLGPCVVVPPAQLGEPQRVGIPACGHAHVVVCQGARSYPDPPVLVTDSQQIVSDRGTER